MDFKSEKRQLREQVKSRMAEMSSQLLKEKTSTIHHNLFNQAEWDDALTIGITLSVGREIDTYTIFSKALSCNKRVAAPKCNPETNTLTFYLINTLDDLEDSFYGLKEPDPNRCKKIAGKDIDLLLVPGVVFSEDGYRVGYGGGYYDRFLSANKELLTCSLAFDCQMKKEIPVEDHDQSVKKIITEERILIL
ncbi:5-formyltetrahydrofolate cyclo-ligase [Alteribacter aurantiacus]|uniref:5-formyltetrahydrofolate cyclo-ligase n=1 Tax=Alteribacter aurantiacus TaxID=254410 RepID=UPI00040C2585